MWKSKSWFLSADKNVHASVVWRPLPSGVWCTSTTIMDVVGAVAHVKIELASCLYFSMKSVSTSSVP